MLRLQGFPETFKIAVSDRVNQDINLTDINTYRNTSKAWRNTITDRFVGRSSSSSAEYQEALFTKAIPPQTLVILGKENRLKGGIIEAYIYRRFAERFTQLSSALQYCDRYDLKDFTEFYESRNYNLLTDDLWI